MPKEIGGKRARFGHGGGHVADRDVVHTHTVQGHGRHTGDAVRGLDRRGEIEGVW
jgi:hypothetical protein